MMSSIESFDDARLSMRSCGLRVRSTLMRLKKMKMVVAERKEIRRGRRSRRVGRWSFVRKKQIKEPPHTCPRG